MIAIRNKLPLLLAACLTMALGLVMWAAPVSADHALNHLVDVTADCDGDVTFTNIHDEVITVAYGDPFDHPPADGTFSFDPGQSETITTSRDAIGIEASNPDETLIQTGTIEIPDCAGGNLLDIEANCDGDVTFTNISDDGLEMTYGDLPSEVDGDLVLDPDQSETINTSRDTLEYSADSASTNSSDRGSIDIPSCRDGGEDEDDDDDDDDDDDEDEDDDEAPDKAPDAGV